MYSPFFTSGFLTGSHCAPSSSALDDCSGPRRSSLPTNSLSSPGPASPAEVDDASAFYFTLQPARSEQEFRSFLSLDLADSHSLRTVSQLRLSSPQRSNSSVRDSATYSNLYTFSWSLSMPKRSSARRPSRDSLRNIPAPKPAPSTMLPSPPGPSKRASATSIPLSVRPTPSFRAGRHADALARLEGRAKDDFIIFNDEEEEESDIEMEMEPEDVVIPLSTIHNTSPTTRRTSKPSSQKSTPTHSHPYSQKSRPRRKSTKNGNVDISFIDLDAHPYYRSFIDVSI